MHTLWISRGSAPFALRSEETRLFYEPTEAWSRSALELCLSERPDHVDIVPQDRADAEVIESAQALAHACGATFGRDTQRPSEAASIPRVLHQLWIGPKRPPLEAMQTWETHNPDLERVVWNEAMLDRWLPRDEVEHAMTCHEINGRADVLRYHILSRFGGVFVDADAVCLARLPAGLFELGAWTCFEDERRMPGLLAAGYMGSSPGHPLMNDLSRRCRAMDLDAFSQRYRAWEFVGNLLLTNVARTLPARVLSRLPSRCFIGTHHSGDASPGRWPQYAEQLWGSTHGYDRPELSGASP